MMPNDFRDNISQQGVYNSTYIADENEPPSVGKECEWNAKEPPVIISSIGKEQKTEKFQMWRSIICNSISLNLSFSVLLTLMNSITSLLPEDNLGVLSLTLASASQLAVTAIFLTFLNMLFGFKRLLLVATLLLIVYTATFLYPTLGMFIPSSLGMGFAFAVAIANGFAYGNALGYWYYKLYEGNLDTILSFFSGLTNSALGGGFLWGNIIYYQVLKPNYSEEVINQTDLSFCGAAYCNEAFENSSATKLPPESRIHNLIYIFLGMVGLAFLLQLFIVDVPENVNSSGQKSKNFFSIFRKFYILIINPRGFLLLIIMLFIGMEEQFAIAVFTNAFVTCTLGVANIGYVMFNFGVAQILSSVAISLVIKAIGRAAVVAITYLSFLSLFVILLTVPASQFSLIAFCIFMFVYAVIDSSMITTVFATYGILFPDDLEGVFALGTLWYSIGSLIGNSINIYTCVYVKLFIMIAIGTVGVANYIILEYMIYKKYLK